MRRDQERALELVPCSPSIRRERIIKELGDQVCALAGGGIGSFSKWGFCSLSNQTRIGNPTFVPGLVPILNTKTNGAACQHDSMRKLMCSPSVCKELLLKGPNSRSLTRFLGRASKHPGPNAAPQLDSKF